MSAEYYSLGHSVHKPKTFRVFLLVFVIVVAVLGGIGWMVVQHNSSTTIVNSPGATRSYPAVKPAAGKEVK